MAAHVGSRLLPLRIVLELLAPLLLLQLGALVHRASWTLPAPREGVRVSVLSHEAVCSRRSVAGSAGGPHASATHGAAVAPVFATPAHWRARWVFSDGRLASDVLFAVTAACLLHRVVRPVRVAIFSGWLGGQHSAQLLQLSMCCVWPPPRRDPFRGESRAAAASDAARRCCCARRSFPRLLRDFSAHRSLGSGRSTVPRCFLGGMRLLRRFGGRFRFVGLLRCLSPLLGKFQKFRNGRISHDFRKGALSTQNH